jgi:hypothetical protein
MPKSFYKDPNSVNIYGVRWCSADNTNDATANDTGVLQSATISTSNWTLDSGITEDSTSLASFTVKGVTFAINTVARITLSGGTAGTDYDVVNRITTSDGRTLDHTITIMCREL